MSLSGGCKAAYINPASNDSDNGLVKDDRRSNLVDLLSSSPSTSMAVSGSAGFFSIKTLFPPPMWGKMDVVEQQQSGKK